MDERAMIDFAERGRVYMLINIKPLDDTKMEPIPFKVDTGADISTISKLDLVALGFDMDWIKDNAVVFKDEDKPTTATGEKIDAGYVKLPLINILGYEGKLWPFQIIMHENQDFRNLLGRDLLTGFNYSFNNDKDKFSIARAKRFKARYNFLPEQEIYEAALNPAD
jgi:hypothetical protein